MGKKRSRASQTSKGERRNVVNGLGDDRTELQKLNDNLTAWQKGKNVMLTIENPIKSETKKRFIRVPAIEVWKRPEPYRMKTKD